MKFIDAIRLLEEDKKLYRESYKSFYYYLNNNTIHEVFETDDELEIKNGTAILDIDKEDWVVE